MFKNLLGPASMMVAILLFVLALVRFHGDWKVGAIFFSLLVAVGGLMMLIDSLERRRAWNRRRL